METPVVDARRQNTPSSSHGIPLNLSSLTPDSHEVSFLGKRAVSTEASLQDASPPPYHDSDSNYTSAAASFNHPRCNYLEVIEKHQATKGTWVVDSSLAIPPSILELQKWGESDGPRPNLNLYNRGSDVKGKIILYGPTDDLVTLKAESHYGSITLRLDNQTQQNTKMNLSSHHGNVTVYLPSSFSGHIECETQYGKVVFSDPVSQNLTRFTTHDGKHLAFLSPTPIPSGPQGLVAFEKASSNMIIKTGYGNVKVFYLEEAPPDQPPVGGSGQPKIGLFGWLFS